MSMETNQWGGRKDSDFGLPQAEFRPIARKRGSGFKTIFLLLLILAIGGGVAYWIFYPTSPQEIGLSIHQPTTANSTSREDERQNSTPTLAAPNNKDHGQQTHNNITNPKTVHKKATTRPVKKISKGTITRLSTPRGYYYIVVGSFIDEDLAGDHAQKLAKKGIDTTILCPSQDSHFFRVAVAQATSLVEAHEKIPSLQELHGTEIWVKKY